LPSKTFLKKPTSCLNSFRNLQILFRLARKRLDSPGDYQNFQRHQGILLANYLADSGIDLRGKRTLDLGCGHGGYALALSSCGAQVVGVDLKAAQRLPGIPTLAADALSLPFRDGSFELVICASLIEHVLDPPALLREMHRVLGPSGRAYLSFPPFYSPLGGHQFSPFHLLGEKWAGKIVRRLGRYKGKTWILEAYPEGLFSYKNAYGSWGLYPVSIARAQKWVQSSPFELLDKSTRWSFINFARWPLINEFLTWHVQFLLTKPDGRGKTN
jgi:SAM-dependent methyltransferase